MSLDLLEAALAGYKHTIEEIEGRLAELRGGNAAGTRQQASADSGTGTRKKRVVSAAARKKMAAAQRKRWADIKAKQAGKS